VTLDDIPGWFYPVDQAAFRLILDQPGSGNLLEIGVYRGKSAVLIGEYVRDDELILCDLFEAVTEHEHIPPHLRACGDDFADHHFFGFWDQFHSWRPTVERSMSSDLELSCQLRFTHIDGCHSYECAHSDIVLAARHSNQDAVIVCDDYRKKECPGVAAAVWEAVAARLLYPFAVTEDKLYAAVTAEAQRRWLDCMTHSGMEQDLYRFPSYDMARLV
jgi:hypothetical protein